MKLSVQFMECNLIIVLIVDQYIVTVQEFVSSEIVEIVRSLRVHTATDSMLQYDKRKGTEQNLCEMLLFMPNLS